MKKETKSLFTGSFLWISSILAFVVDTVTLVSMVGHINVSVISVTASPIRTTLNLGNLVLNWSDITLTIIIYIGLIFLIISLRYDFDRFPQNRVLPFFLFHFLLGLLVLWSLVFVITWDFIFIPRLAGIWLTGLFSLLWANSKAQQGRDYAFFTYPFVILLVALPIWTLVEKSHNNHTWGEAMLITFS